MKNIFILLSCLVMSVFFQSDACAEDLSNGPTEEAKKNLSPYPEKLPAMVRHVIFLEPAADEHFLRVELIPGKTLLVDCNKHRLAGSFTQESLEGWGYPYSVFKSDGHVASTLMGCMEPKEQKFISAESMMVRYNSRLPVVVYMPEDYELKYKIWSAGEERLAEKR